MAKIPIPFTKPNTIAGRPWPNLLAEDIVPANPVLIAIGISVDEKYKTVTARFAGLFARQAKLRPNRGCVLDVDSAEAHAPAADTIADTARPWPQGEAPLGLADWGAGVDADALQKLVRDAFVGAGASPVSERRDGGPGVAR